MCMINNTATITFEDYCENRYMLDWAYNKAHRVLKKNNCIANWVKKNPEYTVEWVEQKIEDDAAFAVQFIVDPTQQLCYQKYCVDYINQYSGATCRALPAGGKNALFVFHGKLYSRDDLPKQAVKLVKSIDLEIKYKDYTIYASHKHTTKDGGNQSNQWYDLMHFSEHACEASDEKIIYIALADGPHYNAKVNDGLTKMEHLQLRDNEHYKAMTTTEFCDWIHTL